ncbi:MAG TPA: hypothetical protein VMD28_05710 [Acidimicrobiales bacterium]|nr:hypothetical protein [Acidimicrobiales bacterium]
MSQHLIDTSRLAADREEQQRGARREAGGERNGSDPRERDDFEGNGSGTAGRAEARTGEVRQDATLRALEALSDALSEVANDRELLERRLRELHRQRAEGRAWRDILAEEDAPGTMQIVSRMLACLAKASGTLRKELVDTLRREGVSIPSIAKLFGVTHQRVSNLLRRPVE